MNTPATPTIRKQVIGKPTEFPRRSFFLYGEPKVGKSTTASQFPRPLILNVLAENGVGQIAGDVVDLANIEDLPAITRWLKTGKHDYQTVVLDGLTTLALDVIARSGSRDTRAAVKDATAALRGPLHEFLSLDLIRVLTGHPRKDEDEMIVDGRKASKLSIYPDLPPRLRLFIEGRVDALGYCYPGNGKSLVWWLPLDTDTPKPRAIAAGNRLGLPRTTELSFAAIQAAIVAPANGHTPAPTPAPAHAPTPAPAR